MSLLACHKLIKHTDPFVRRFHPELELSFTALGLCCSISFPLANVGSDILVLGPFFPILSISFDSGHLI